jgi:hypothetical protein
VKVLIKVSLNDVVNSTQTFNKLMQQPFKGSLAFKIARLARELEKEMQTFNDERMKIIRKYGKKDENGELIVGEDGNVSFENDKINDLNSEFNSLLETELEINADKLPMDSIDEFELTPQEIIGLEKFFE